MSKTLLRFRNRHGALLPLVIACSACVGPARAGDDLFEMSLGELLDLEVTSVSKKSQPVAQAAAAVFVITADDIRRSGVTTIPEILRMAPGIEVSQVDGNKWAVSARGFQNRFSNKLLVLMDGRTLYSPLFSGVFWDAQDTLIEDIERIEIVRGPGATLWGANAVNGVINIITRDAKNSGGTLLSAGAGNQERGYASLRHGGNIGDSGSYRVYAKQLSREGNTVGETGQAAVDSWDQSRVGFRIDMPLESAATLTLQGDAYRGDSGETFVDYSLAPPYRQLLDGEQAISGYNLLARFNTEMASGDQLTVQTFVDTARRDWQLVDLDRTSFDIDVDYRAQRFAGHDVLFGMNYRLSRDDIQGSSRLEVTPDEREEELVSVFVQDDWELIPDTLSVVLGMKLELNDYTGLEVQPNLRLLWRPDAQSSVWSSVARAVRTPGRLDRDVQLVADLLPPLQPGGLPTQLGVVGNLHFDAETLIAYEAGFKREVSDHFAWDVAVFYNDYQDVRSFTPVGSRCVPGGSLPFCLADPATQAVSIDSQWTNVGTVDSFGAEWAGTLQLSPRLRVKGAYSYIDQDSTAPPESIPEVAAGDPRHQVSLRFAYQPFANVDMDLWLRYLDKNTILRAEIDAYTTLDTRLAWRPFAKTELSLVGRNLLDSTRVQFRSELDDVPEIAIQRSLHFQLRYEF